MEDHLIYDTAIAVEPEFEADLLRHTKTWAEIDLGALRRNYHRIRDFVQRHSPQCETMCILKADAYGHGAVMCAKALWSEGVRLFGVSCITEAIQLRSALGMDADVTILILGYTLPSDVDLLYKYHISQTVFSLEYAHQLCDEITRLRSVGNIAAQTPLPIHLKINTGMNRLGFSFDDADRVAAVCEMKEFDAEGIFTHFACADDEKSDMTAVQYQRFTGMLSALSSRGIHFLYRHACNSPAVLLDTMMYENTVRFGMLLYGCLTPDAPLETEPVMNFKTTVSHIFQIHKGDTVSYGATFRAARDTVVATLPVGYADGLIRSMGGASVSVEGHMAPIIGRICMDQCMIDITDFAKDVKVGDTVTIFGSDPHMIDALATVAGTIPYEILCLVGKRVTRVYRDTSAELKASR